MDGVLIFITSLMSMISDISSAIIFTLCWAKSLMFSILNASSVSDRLPLASRATSYAMYISDPCSLTSSTALIESGKRQVDMC